MQVVDRPELCLLSSPEDRPVFNAVLRSRGSASRLPALVGEVRAAHAGRRPRWMLGPLDAAVGLEPLLRAAGYQPGEEHDGYSHPTDGALRPLPADIEARAVQDLDGMRDWVEVSGRAFGEPRVPDRAELRLFLSQCTGPGARVFRAVAYDRGSGAPLSAGGLTLFPRLGFGMLWAGGTVPEARGRGAWTAVLAARRDHAFRLGIGRIGLYARRSSSGPLVARMGFARHGPMIFWEHLC